MLPVLLLWLWCGYILGFVTMAITHPVSGAMAAEPSPPTTDFTTQIDPELYDKAIMHDDGNARPLRSSANIIVAGTAAPVGRHRGAVQRSPVPQRP